MVFFVGRQETSPDSITQEWIAAQSLIQEEAEDQRDLVQTGQHLLKFMNQFVRYVDKCTFFHLVPFFSVNFQIVFHH